jgi:hypothetical protein
VAVLAAPAVAQLNRDLEEEWRAKVNGEKPQARNRYDDAVLDARGLGFGYLTTAASRSNSPKHFRFV